MNQKGGMDDIVKALVGLFVAVILFYVVMVVWEPITTMHLYPLLENAESFTYGSTAVTLLQVMVLVAAAAILIAFFSEARGERRPPPSPYYG